MMKFSNNLHRNFKWMLYNYCFAAFN